MNEPRSGAGCVSCCVCFLRRGGRCPCCAGRRRGIVQFMDKVVLPTVVQGGGFGPDSAARASAVAVLGQGGDMPVVATTGAVLGHGGDMPVVATTGAVLGQGR